jgi:hypothetical protein
MLICNAFSANMLSSFPATVHIAEISLEEAKAKLAGGVNSAVGHADTAAVFSTVLGVEVPANRVTVALSKGDRILVGQYCGPRLQEGATTLPAGATIKWLLVDIS